MTMLIVIHHAISFLYLFSILIFVVSHYHFVNLRLLLVSSIKWKSLDKANISIYFIPFEKKRRIQMQYSRIAIIFNNSRNEWDKKERKRTSNSFARNRVTIEIIFDFGLIFCIIIIQFHRFGVYSSKTLFDCRYISYIIKNGFQVSSGEHFLYT